MMMKPPYKNYFSPQLQQNESFRELKTNLCIFYQKKGNFFTDKTTAK